MKGLILLLTLLALIGLATKQDKDQVESVGCDNYSGRGSEKFSGSLASFNLDGMTFFCGGHLIEVRSEDPDIIPIVGAGYTVTTKSGNLVSLVEAGAIPNMPRVKEYRGKCQKYNTNYYLCGDNYFYYEGYLDPSKEYHISAMEKTGFLSVLELQ